MWEVRESSELGERPIHYAYFVHEEDAQLIQREDPEYRYVNSIILYESASEFRDRRDSEVLTRAQQKVEKYFTADERRMLGI